MDQYLTPAYGYWCRKISEDFLWNRKQWEFVFIAQALWERGFLKPGKLGIGFGVGKEPLSALFASFGCRIIATDAPEDTAYVPAWKDTDQYAASLEDLNEKGVCAPEDFRRLVTFRFVDMNVLPEDLPAADFIWSYCSAEHIGSMDKTKDFLVKSMKCLKPGGLAVHTTEFNVSSDEETLDIPTLALLRKKDIIEIERRLSYGGHRVAPIDFDPGQGILDQIVDCLPFSPDAQPHLKLFLSGFVATSIGLIVEKGRTDD
jgi:SAM-dependent methyltransferase